ncbi:hypothetical protein [Spirilliplanes yamanashiensis]|uniref:Uncharacterized protein n=1 Tax=Spirilliplanes yamanashiensis TaxID=42233 RepID=A0A8J3YDI1_9ACTN|nr:hypothetical protein [Spirilliplanes yamanashiensis]MDP9816433.1 hypothetical protein [Spirilliplanes yamanashiensis]GIJ05960.1 hypothetical protein Sya03_53120 [Spirilliplanes yamanashiensis]
MNGAKYVAAAAAVLLCGSCAHRDAETERPYPNAESVEQETVPVPAGCDPARGRVAWSPAVRSPEPIRIVRDRSRVQPESEHARLRMVERPFRPAIAGLAAPRSWRARLAASLSAATGDTVLATAARPGTAAPPADPAGPAAEIIRYEVAQAVSADFVVPCGPGVRGRFTGWTAVTAGTVSCADAGAATDPTALVVLQYCSDAPPWPGDPED